MSLRDRNPTLVGVSPAYQYRRDVELILDIQLQFVMSAGFRDVDASLRRIALRDIRAVYT